MFARFEIMPTFASAITKTVLLSLETNVAKVPTDAGSKRNFEKKFSKKFLKNLVVQNISLIFAPLSAPKNGSEFFKRFFDLLVIQRENVVFICQFL